MRRFFASVLSGFFVHADTAWDCRAIRGGSAGYYEKVCLQTQQQTRDDLTISVVHGDKNLPSSHFFSVEQNSPGAQPSSQELLLGF